MKRIIIVVIMTIVSFTAISQTYNTNAHINQYYMPNNFDSCMNKDLFAIDTLTWNECMSYPFFLSITYDMAQPYHIDAPISIIGIAVALLPYTTDSPYSVDFQLRDADSNILASAIFDTMLFDSLATAKHRFFELMFNAPIKIEEDFNIIVSKPEDAINYTDSHLSILISHCNTGYYPFNWLYPYNCPSGWAGSSGIGHKNAFAYMFPILYTIIDTTGQDTSSLTNIQKDSYIQIYPNPAQEEITIACYFNIQTIEVYNLLGQKIEERKVNGYTTKLNTQSYSKGTYTCKIKTDNGFAVKKFVVQ